MSKQKQVEEYLKQPIQVGDEVYVKGFNSRNPEFRSLKTVEGIEGDNVILTRYRTGDTKVPISQVEKASRYVGQDPFQPEMRVQTYQVDIDQIIYRFGWNMGPKKNIELKQRFDDLFGLKIPEISDDPFIIKNGERIKFQRPLVWSLDDKQKLIDSIYNNVDIGKFIIRRRSFEWVKEQIYSNNPTDVAFADIVDGKQRFNCIVEFIQGKFPDSYGNYWEDLSDIAHMKFLGYRNLSFGEMDENATDQEVLSLFLAINHTGVPMSKEHIDFVKSLRG